MSLKDLGQLIALEGLAQAEEHGARHVLKFVDIVDSLLTRRFQFEKTKARLILPGYMDPIKLRMDEDKYWLKLAVKNAGLKEPRLALKYLFRSFAGLGLSHLREAYIDTLWGDPGTLLRGCRVQENELWAPQIPRRKWDEVHLEVRN